MLKNQVLKIDNFINQFSDRSKIVFSSAFSLANQNGTITTSLHILYIILKDSDKYIKDILVSLTSNIDDLKSDIYLLLNKGKKISSYKEADKSIQTLINTSKMLLKQFDDQVITQEILLLSFTIINDQAKEILLKYNITYDTVLKEIQKFRKGKNAMNKNAESGFDTLNRFAINLTIRSLFFAIFKRKFIKINCSNSN